MAMSIQQKRNKVAELYDGPGWKYRVYHEMSVRQICKIYDKFYKEGELKKLKQRRKIQRENEGILHDQMTIWDWIKEKNNG